MYRNIDQLTAIIFLEQTSLKFQLDIDEQPNGALKIISFDSNVNSIRFYVRGLVEKRCSLNDIQELSREYVKKWDSVKHLLSDIKVVRMQLTLKVSELRRLIFWLKLFRVYPHMHAH